VVRPISELETQLANRRYRRRHSKDKPPDNRAEGERDRDRILYSSAYRRLGGVTQVVWAREEGHLFHNRLTHSAKVAQLGQRIAQKLEREAKKSTTLRRTVVALGGLDPNVAEAAGLGHDLGHPPFGHIAEDALKAHIRAEGVPDGFEGNAQTFRIVTKLAAHDEDMPGLNLTWATLNALLKYPKMADGVAEKYGAYSTEQEDFDWARQGLGLAPEERSLEAQIMDWSDDIAYAVHDLEDFFRAGLIPMAMFDTVHDLRSVWDAVEGKWHSEWGDLPLKRDQEEVFGTVVVLFPAHGPWHATRTERARLRSYTSSRIGQLVGRTSLTAQGLDVARSARIEAEFLKQLTREYVINGPMLTTQQAGQIRLVEQLYAMLRDALKTGNAKVFPAHAAEEVAEALEEPENKELGCRAAADVISGLTEAQAVHLYQRLAGVDFGPLLDPAVL